MRKRAHAAIYFEPEGFSTSGERLMGRHAAGEGFLRGYVRHSGADPLACAVRSRAAAKSFADTCGSLAGRRVAVRWMGLGDHAALARLGTLFVPGPGLAAQAWRRQRGGADGYSLCGVTHTISSGRAMDGIADLLLAPLAPWDAVICTSRAVLDATRRLLDGTEHYLRERFDARRLLRPTLALIPLGVDCDALAPDPAARLAWRSRLGIGADDAVVLFVGRLSFHAKANPFAMYRALEAAAGRVPRRLHLIQAGWFSNAAIEREFREGARAICPSVNAIFLDGRQPDVRAGIWHAADLFTSLSDNIQETFGLTPVEAMAAGLPGVISDWNGYRDTVRDGQDGFRIGTLMPPPPAGELLARRHADGVDTYDHYIGLASLSVAVDIPACADAYARLAADPALRRSMGESARQRARAEFDWSVIVRRYQALWAELGEARAAGGAVQPAAPGDPRRPDPFRLFGSYPTRILAEGDRVALAPGATAASAARLRTSPLGAFGVQSLASGEVTARILETVAASGSSTVAELLHLGEPGEAAAAVLRTIVWLCKVDLLRVAG